MSPAFHPNLLLRMIKTSFSKFTLILAGANFSLMSPLVVAQTPPPEKGFVEAGGKFVPNKAEPVAGERSIPQRVEHESPLLKDLKVERVDSNLLKIGLVTINQATRSIRFQASVNMNQGPVEYLVVAENGKLHEAVFMTKASLRDIHLAMVLLGVKPGGFMPKADKSLTVPEESSVNASVEWEGNGPIVKHPLTSIILLAGENPNAAAIRTLDEGVWLYNGSKFDAGGFQALREGSVISLIADDSALVNNPGSDRTRDDIHLPNTLLLPPMGTPVSIILTLLPKASPLPNP